MSKKQKVYTVLWDSAYGSDVTEKVYAFGSKTEALGQFKKLETEALDSIEEDESVYTVNRYVFDRPSDYEFFLWLNGEYANDHIHLLLESHDIILKEEKENEKL